MIAIVLSTMLFVSGVQATSRFGDVTAVLHPSSFSGKVDGVDRARMTFTVKANGASTMFKTSEETVFLLDGRETGMFDALAAGRTAHVTHNGAVASRVEVSSN